MIALTNTTHILEVTTSEATAVDVLVSYVDHTTSGGTLGDEATLITTATTTTVLSAPAASTQRQIKMINIMNTGSTANIITVKKDISATEYDLVRVSLQANERLQYLDGQGWTSYTADGQSKIAATSTAPLYASNYVLSGMLYENRNRNECQEVNTALLTSGRLSLEAIYLPAGTTINNISCSSATTLAGTPQQKVFSGIFCSTTEPAPTTDQAPIVTPGATFAPIPIKTPCFIWQLPAILTPGPN
jgi:hypothetical protein